MSHKLRPSQTEITKQREVRARSSGYTIITSNNISGSANLTLSEALILGLLKLGVRSYFTVFGHGSTEVGEVLRIYQQAGLFKVFGVRSEIEASHAATALLASAAAETPFSAVALTGDGSFTMNPQNLIDGAEHHARGCILLLDNGRMGAISGLQQDQYGVDFATWNRLRVDYLAWARAVPGWLALDGGRKPASLKAALEQAGKHAGLTLVHVPVYYGLDPLGGMGVYGRWNVGNWSEDVQKLRHDIGL